MTRSNKKIRLIIASPHSRHDALEHSLKEKLDVEILRVRDQSDLELSKISSFMPKYIFFPHWSWIIPVEIFERYECVIFHMTDVPYGRGGSPLQNLIVRGFKETKLSALRCVAELDAGPVYMKQQLSLTGTAEEILSRVSKLTEKMIEEIVLKEPAPIEQVGEPTIFRRRLPEDGNLANLSDLEKLFDYIRMLDADGYPAAFIETDSFKFSFSHAKLNPDSVLAEVRITRRNS